MLNYGQGGSFSILPSTPTKLNSIHRTGTMSTHPTMLSDGTITVGETVLPAYQFSQTDYAFPLRTILQFLELENHQLPPELKSFIAINKRTNLSERFIIIDENFVNFLIELSQKNVIFRLQPCCKALQFMDWNFV